MDDSKLCYPMYCLIVDDNTQEAAMSRKILRTLGIHVHSATNPSRAIELAYRIPFDVIFMEISLNSVSGAGIETTRVIRSLPQMRGFVPIMALTRDRTPENLNKCFQAGMSNYLLKPLSTEALLAALAPILEKKRLAHGRGVHQSPVTP
jgi:CheY-like chemotaxis protein